MYAHTSVCALVYVNFSFKQTQKKAIRKYTGKKTNQYNNALMYSTFFYKTAILQIHFALFLLQYIFLKNERFVNLKHLQFTTF